MFNNWARRLKLSQVNRSVDREGFWSGLESFVMISRHHREAHEILAVVRPSHRKAMFGHVYDLDLHTYQGIGNVVHYSKDFHPDMLLHLVYFSDDTICIDTISTRVSIESASEDSRIVGKSFSEIMKKLSIKLKNPSDANCPGRGAAQRVFINMMDLSDMVAQPSGAEVNAAKNE